ncbi:hypothetical protein [Methylocystis parvus]|uniref:hypothetical protein n=1 Tax=Methylocystis parvus TaxID=134 RepID=UPI000375495A|nr:hypothetical protein [Methylocystis parvus]WBJ98495.1 hypothetical protein MMG94_10655 [Methylocystis parvus OBBP]
MLYYASGPTLQPCAIEIAAAFAKRLSPIKLTYTIDFISNELTAAGVILSLQQKLLAADNVARSQAPSAFWAELEECGVGSHERFVCLRLDASTGASVDIRRKEDAP